MVQNNYESIHKFWATHLFLCSFARTTHSFAALVRSVARSFIHFQAREKVTDYFAFAGDFLLKKMMKPLAEWEVSMMWSGQPS